MEESSKHIQKVIAFIKKICFGIICFFASQNAFPGFWALTHHSRANCYGFNETVSWWAGHSFYAHVVSHHYPHGKSNKNSSLFHIIDLGKQYTFRHAAYHAKESGADGDYRVIGFHYMYVKGAEVEAQRDIVTDCNIYDGWWD